VPHLAGVDLILSLLEHVHSFAWAKLSLACANATINMKGTNQTCIKTSHGVAALRLLSSLKEKPPLKLLEKADHLVKSFEKDMIDKVPLESVDETLWHWCACW
jgi:hypothetical protein